MAVLAFPPGAWAVGELTPAGCVDDNDELFNDLCAQTADGLDFLNEAVVSPDGRSVYAGSQDDAAVVRFDRSANGALTPAGCIDDNDTGLDDCARSINGLDDVNAIAVSPDGRSVYVAASGDDDALVRFNRSASGVLTPAGCIDDNDSGADVCPQSINGLSGASGVAVSPDGTSVYVTGAGDQAVVTFNRSATGALTPAGCIDDNDTGTDTCARSVNGLDGTGAVTVSPDGNSVYVASFLDDALVRFTRDETGALTPAGCIDDNDTGPDVCAQSVNGLEGAGGVAVSADGDSVYVAASDDSAVVLFNRSSTGALTSGGCIDDNDTGDDGCAQSVNGLDVPIGLAVSPDGASVYAAAFFDDAIVRFNRSTSGALSPGGCIDDNDTGADVCAQAVNGLDGATSVTVSPDGDSVYAAGKEDAAVVRFNRQS